jgi:hypothetical protein
MTILPIILAKILEFGLIANAPFRTIELAPANWIRKTVPPTA